MTPQPIASCSTFGTHAWPGVKRELVLVLSLRCALLFLVLLVLGYSRCLRFRIKSPMRAKLSTLTPSRGLLDRIRRAARARSATASPGHGTGEDPFRVPASPLRIARPLRAGVVLSLLTGAARGAFTRPRSPLQMKRARRARPGSDRLLLCGGAERSAHRLRGPRHHFPAVVSALSHLAPSACVGHTEGTR